MLARKTLIHEWRKFLPAIFAVAFSGLLLLTQASLVLGIFGNAAVFVTRSNADLWVGYPGTPTIDQGLPIHPDVEMRMRMHPGIAATEPFLLRYADWRSPALQGGMNVAVSGISARDDALMFARLLPAELRRRLNEPGAVIVDRADLDKLGTADGQRATINGRPVHVVGVVQGLRALDGANVLASIDTTRALESGPAADHPTYLVARLHDPRQVAAVSRQLAGPGFGPFEAWSAADLSSRTQHYWLFETGAGAGVLFLAGVVFLAGAAITSQTLLGAIAGSLRAYATLKAMGVSGGALRKVVLEQAFWVGILGVALSVALGLLLMLAARGQDVPLAMDPAIAALCIGLIMTISLISGVFAVRRVQRADPASLLR